MNTPLRCIMDKGPWASDPYRVETVVNRVKMAGSSWNKRKNQHFLKTMLKVDAEPRFFLDGQTQDRNIGSQASAYSYCRG